MDTDEKKCPRCAETVKAEAKVCRHCGYDFETGQGAGTTAHPVPPTGKSKTKQGLLGCVGLIVLLVIIGMIFGGGSEDGAETGSAGETKAAEVQATPVSARQLAAAYEANEAAAQQQYGNKPLLVTGTVAGVELDFSDKPMLKLQGTNQFLDVQADLDEESQKKASSISKGQSITLRCTGVSEVMSIPMLKGCSLQG
ncbi:MAG TPA: zinc ribbon domain-containing protein [Allosphingosinicella sp.]|jgi:hypothetical protein